MSIRNHSGNNSFVNQPTCKDDYLHLILLDYVSLTNLANLKSCHPFVLYLNKIVLHICITIVRKLVHNDDNNYLPAYILNKHRLKFLIITVIYKKYEPSVVHMFPGNYTVACFDLESMF